jgi:hypothetical protein
MDTPVALRPYDRVRIAPEFCYASELRGIDHLFGRYEYRLPAFCHFQHIPVVVGDTRHVTITGSALVLFWWLRSLAREQ